MSGPLSSPVSGLVMDFSPFETRTEADPTHQYGSLVQTNQGLDVYRFGKVGASNVTKAKLQLAPAPIANHNNILVAAAAASGAKKVTVALGATAAALSEYDEGKLITVDGTGEGQTMTISHNPAAALSTNMVVTLADSLTAALATTSEVTLVHNAYNAFVEAASKTRRAAGIPLINLSAGDFGWLKTKGTVAALGGSAVTLGARLTSDGSTAGAVTDNTDVTTVQTEVEIGQASIVAGVTGEEFPIVLSID